MRRGIGYVIQQGGLFPHRRVFDNVAVVPRLLRWDAARTDRRVNELLELVGLDPKDYARRFPHELSGGERQRVGVARALGAILRCSSWTSHSLRSTPSPQRLQNQFLELQQALKKAIVFVTHDTEEAAKLGDRIAVLSKGGALEQYDTSAEILGCPATPFVADFVGADRGVRRLASSRSKSATWRGRPWCRPPPRWTRSGVWPTTPRPRRRWWSTTRVGWRAGCRSSPSPTGRSEPTWRSSRPRCRWGRPAGRLGEMLQHDVRWLVVTTTGATWGSSPPTVCMPKCDGRWAAPPSSPDVGAAVRLRLGIVTPVVHINPRFDPPSWESTGTIEDILAVAKAAERFGYDWVACSEHIAIPLSATDVRGPRYWDPVTTLSFVAASTARVSLLSHVVVLGYHHPLELVKRWGTLDVASGGRVILGVGVGSLQPEFELLGHRFHGRGERADDAVRAIRASWGVARALVPRPALRLLWLRGGTVGSAPTTRHLGGRPHPAFAATGHRAR